ncbi:hypothetical protein [Chenggangzhangella methanolivorans]|uniref:Uncharacterized protein n=1 Tax=Chenggangzhangella methanolivorans TaxID=1437009 RepID=A0A9E6R969_9HYPH|nr:hypothetical protein [Chenggangzhangella methanolivorans]QZO00506.1 hypothetical protein K6K41_01845 [Chenggangzhangella methanolivorans]
MRRGFEDGAHAAFDAIDERKAASTVEAVEEVDEEAPVAKRSRRKAATAEA